MTSGLHYLPSVLTTMTTTELSKLLSELCQPPLELFGTCKTKCDFLFIIIGGAIVARARGLMATFKLRSSGSIDVLPAFEWSCARSNATNTYHYCSSQYLQGADLHCYRTRCILAQFQSFFVHIARLDRFQHSLLRAWGLYVSEVNAGHIANTGATNFWATASTTSLPRVLDAFNEALTATFASLSHLLLTWVC